MRFLSPLGYRSRLPLVCLQYIPLVYKTTSVCCVLLYFLANAETKKSYSKRLVLLGIYLHPLGCTFRVIVIGLAHTRAALHLFDIVSALRCIQWSRPFKDFGISSQFFDALYYHLHFCNKCHLLSFHLCFCDSCDILRFLMLCKLDINIALLFIFILSVVQYSILNWAWRSYSVSLYFWSREKSIMNWPKPFYVFWTCNT